MKGENNKVLIQYTTTGVLAHECEHVVQYIGKGNELKFNAEGLLLNEALDYNGRIKNEIAGYQMQYAYDGALVLPGEKNNIYINRMNDINKNNIGAIFNKAENKFVYR